MSRIFIEFYFDEDVSVLVAELVRARGFSVATTQGAGNLGKSDEEQFAHAVNWQKAFVTHNRADFERLAREYFASGTLHYGIVIAVRRPPREIARRLLSILNQVTADEMVNQIRYI